jgi:lysozyme
LVFGIASGLVAVALAQGQSILRQMTTMQLSPDGVAAIYRRECKPPNFEPELTAYDDGSGNPTIGCGHSGPDVHLGQTITREQADALFRADIRPCEAAVNANVTVPLTQNQFDALCSWTFNVGIGALQSSTLLKVLNAGKYEQVPAQMLKWVHSGGKVNNGLINRRNSEIGQWTRGAFVSSATVAVDPPPSWWQQWHNRIIATGITGAFSGIGGDALHQAGTELQGLSQYGHVFATLGLGLIVLGIVWNLRKAN